MKFNLDDFMQLDTKALLAVNGGTHCGGETDSSGYASSSGSNSYGARGGGGGSGGGSSGGGSGGGGCSRFDLTPFINNTKKTSQTETSVSTSSGGGSCSGVSKIQNNSTTEMHSAHITTSNPNDVHCDVIAWNHAVDSHLNPRGVNGTDWDVDNNNVNQIFNEHFADKAVGFDSNSAGHAGYIFYDWTGNGTFDHIEFARINSEGTGYSYYSNQGFEQGETFETRSFATDSNAHARNGGPGIVVFIPID